MKKLWFQQFDPDMDAPEGFRLPHLGQRIVKTTIAVFLCLMIYSLRGYSGQNMPTEAAITAIVCMQPYVQEVRKYAEDRFLGTLIGIVWALALLLVLLVFPALGTIRVCLYAMMAAGVLLSLYTAVLLRAPDTSGLAAIVFLCIVISFPDIDAPLEQAGHRILDVMIGTVVATAVNVFRLPRHKNRDLVFFLRTKDLAPDRFSHIPPAALFRLNYLYNDGARICLMSEHAPAFFMLQMGAAKLNTPMIVMDGAAIYDPHENTYLQAETLPPEASAAVMAQLDRLGVSYFIYTIHNDKTCIFHQGEIRAEEQVIYERMRRSPYRSYLEGEILKPEEIVYLKIIAPEAEIPRIAERVQPAVPPEKLRAVCRPQAGSPELGSLYIYAAGADLKHAGLRLMELLWQDDESLKPVPVLARSRYRSERDAIHLLHQVEKRYAPPVLFSRRREP